MVTKKDQEFVQFLLETTRTGKTVWEPTAQPGEFITTFRGSYTVSVSRTTLGALLVLTDESDQQLLVLSEGELDDVMVLYDYVRRIALQVDSVIDRIMKKEGDLLVIEAAYGCRNHRVDVTKQLNAKIVDDRLHIYVGNQLAGDPCPNIPKDLVVRYRHKSQKLEKTVVEGESLDLP